MPVAVGKFIYGGKRIYVPSIPNGPPFCLVCGYSCAAKDSYRMMFKYDTEFPFHYSLYIQLVLDCLVYFPKKMVFMSESFTEFQAIQISCKQLDRFVYGVGPGF